MDYSKRALGNFLGFAVNKGLVNSNTGGGWRVACQKILEDVADDEDVRSVDVSTAIRKYINRHPGELSPASLGEYQRRLVRAIGEFVSYTDDPANYKPSGKSPTKSVGQSEAKTAKRKARPSSAIDNSSKVQMLALPPPPVTSGLTLEYPLRQDFLAQIVIPRDLSAQEARRLGAFILTLANDFVPNAAG